MKRKKELIVILSSLLVIVLSVSVAYFTTKILGTGKEISVESADLKVIFTSGSGTINGTNIEPGWSSEENTFTVKNESNGTYKYNIIIKDLVNTFVTEGFLQYKITSTDGGYNMIDFVDVPKVGILRDTPIAYDIDIEKNITHNYKIEFRYLSSDTVDQSEDMGKTLSGKIFIVKGTEGPTLTDQLFNNNPTISERVDFSTPFTTNTSNTLYKATENGTDVYYFAGVESVDGKCLYNGQELSIIGPEMTGERCTNGMVCQKPDGTYVLYTSMNYRECNRMLKGTIISDAQAEWIPIVRTVNNWVKVWKT